MTKYSVEIKNSAKSDLKKIKDSHLKSQFLEIIETLKTNPYEPTQGYEKLQLKSLGRYSRRINYQHRVVYTINEIRKVILILSAWTHYE